jgi:prepilin-type N-terminal cleavage/methylation domain-containing protein
MLMRAVDQRGFTLVELMVAIAVGIVVLLGAFTVIDGVFAKNQKIVDRQDAVARGRQALALIVRQLGSQVCLSTNPATTPIVSGDGQFVSFYAYLGDPTTAPPTSRDPVSGQVYPSKYTITYTAGANGAPGSISESVAAVTSFGNPVGLGPATTKTIATNVLPSGIYPSNALFAYYPAATSGSSAVSTTSMTPPLSSTTAPTVVQIGIAFKVVPTSASSASSQSTTLQDQVFWRAVDPADPGDTPCVTA